VNGGKAYQLGDGMIAQTIQQWGGCLWFERIMVVDCDSYTSILVPTQPGVPGAKDAHLDGPPLARFLQKRGATTVDELTEVFGENWTKFDDYLVGLNNGNGPQAYCGCFREDIFSEKDQ
jgi:hypothetical protein